MSKKFEKINFFKKQKEQKNSSTNELPNNTITKKYKGFLIFFFIILLALGIRIAWLQFVQGASLKESAYKQQTTNRIISPKRGTIYDSTGKTLALSSVVDTITINPSKITGKDEASTKEKKELVAKGLSDIFGLNYDEVLAKVNSDSSVETIIKKVDQDKVDELQKWMEDNKISIGINIDEDTKRTYPYNNLASNLLGFCDDDNVGRHGVELKWNDTLTGTPGKIVTSKDAFQDDIPDDDKTYIPAENGSDLVLTIDVNIQSIVEKYLKQAVEDNQCTKGGTVIAMDPSTGDVLAMACYPDFNLNTPFEPNESLKATWDTLDTAGKTEALTEMWRNRLVSSTYEPGSPFKLITAAVALEENITSEDVPNDFICQGYEQVADRKISCWSQQHKGPKTLRQALELSCNPSLMQLGKRIGAETLYKYYGLFGFFSKTGIDLPSESSSIFWDLDNVGPVELATMSFGQRINITPIQLITAVSAIANDGILMQPRVVKQIINTETNTTTDLEPVEVRQVISKSTSERMRNLMRSVVTDGSGRRADVAGYSIGGKTGTSEPPVGKPEEGYIASYIAIAPTEKPEIVLLMALHDPKGGSHQGGQICGPVVGQMLSEILPYLGLNSENVQATVTTEGNTSEFITVPDIRNKTVTEAEKVLKQAGFQVKVTTSGDKNSLLVQDQTPAPGTTLSKDSIIMLYTEENDTKVSVAVPDLKGLTAEQAKNSLISKNLNIQVEGSGVVTKQDINPNTSVEEGTVIKVTLEPN